jgi:2-keto-3-deoxy-L-rhamnonate aldolase RhmA
MKRDGDATMTAADLRTKILAGAPAHGGMIFEFATPGIAKIMANAGCEYIIYDMEHTGLSLDTLRYQVAACRGLPIVPMMRPVRGQYRDIAAALDIGMKGIMVPMVESRAEAEAIVEASHYPPVGRRGAAFGFAHDDYTDGAPVDKIATANAEVLVIAQIETERGLADVEAIAAVDGVDVLWVGQFDLTNFLGIPGQFDHPDYLAALDRIVAAAKANGKALGVMAPNAAWAKDYRAKGFTMIAAGPDMAFVAAGVRAILAPADGA